MIEGLKPYSQSAKLKPMIRTSAINIPWLNLIPEHWKVVRAKGLFSARTERARSDDVQLSATQAYGVIPQKEFERRVGRKVVQITQHLDKRAHVEPDDFVISMRSFQGGLERAWARGCIRSSYVVLKPSPETRVSYFTHLFKSLDYIRALQATGNFIRDGQDLNFNNFSLVDLPLPPPDEQADIAKCLEHANRKIDGFIRAKRKLIGLLSEQKQAIIHRAVTRGLHPDVPHKPSGIPWLGDIPKHWEQHSLWTLTKLRTDRNPGDLQLLSVFLDRGVIRYDEGGGQVHAPSLNLWNYQVVIPGDFVLNNQQAWRGSVGVSCHHGIISPAYIVLKLSRKLNSTFANYLMRCRAMVDQFVAASKGVGDIQRQVFWPFLRMVQVPIPNLEEQGQIVNFLTNETRSLNTAIARTEREIALMQEYRTRLTADLVTGKLDVREAAAKLPEVDQAEAPISDDAIETDESIEEEP